MNVETRGPLRTRPRRQHERERARGAASLGGTIARTTVPPGRASAEAIAWVSSPAVRAAADATPNAAAALLPVDARGGVAEELLHPIARDRGGGRGASRRSDRRRCRRRPRRSGSFASASARSGVSAPTSCARLTSPRSSTVGRRAEASRRGRGRRDEPVDAARPALMDDVDRPSTRALPRDRDRAPVRCCRPRGSRPRGKRRRRRARSVLRSGCRRRARALDQSCRGDRVGAAPATATTPESLRSPRARQKRSRCARSRRRSARRRAPRRRSRDRSIRAAR